MLKDGRTRSGIVSLPAADPSPPLATVDALRALLEELLNRVAHVEDALDFILARLSKLSRQERDLLGQLLPVLWRATAGAASETDKALEPVAAVDRAEDR